MLQKFDPRNKEIRIWIDGTLYPRDQAKVSVFDSVVQGGDAVWEGLRLYESGILHFNRHLRRLEESAHAMLFQGVPERERVKEAVFSCLKANDMRKDVHIRLTLTRGIKITSGMDPRLNQAGCSLIVLPEWKMPVYDNEKGITVITSSIRRNAPQFVDSKIHHNNLINNILAKAQANIAGTDAALLLDQNGFASELNGTNIFIIKDEVLLTPYAEACLPGITRGFILELARAAGIPCEERNLSLTEIYNADECFASGTMGELTPIREVDGRKIGRNGDGSLFRRIELLFREAIPRHCEAIPL